MQDGRHDLRWRQLCGVDAVHGEAAVLSKDRRFGCLCQEVPVVAVAAALPSSSVTLGAFAGELKADVWQEQVR
jgi:hypothetical protein